MDSVSVAVLYSAVIGFLSAMLLFIVWKFSRQRSRHVFMAIQVCILILIFGFIMDLNSTTLEDKLAWNDLEYFGHIFTPMLVLVFSLYHTNGDRWLQKKYMVPLIGFSIVLFLIFILDPLNHLYYTSVTLSADPVRSFEAEHGPVYFVYAITEFVQLTLAAIILYRFYHKTRMAEKKRIFVLELAVLFPVITTALVFVLWQFIAAELLIITGILLSSIFLFIGTFSFELFRMLPYTFDGTVRTLKDGVVILDEYERILFVNPEFERVLGQSNVKDLPGRCLREVVIGFPVEAFSNKDGNSYHEYNDQELWPGKYYDIQVSSIVSKAGKNLSYLIILKDISVKRQMEDEIRKSRERYLGFFKSDPTPILISRKSDGLVIDMNDSFERFTGYERSESIGKLSLKLNLWTDLNDRLRYVEIFDREGRVRNFETRFKLKDGRIADVSMTGELIEQDGETLILALISDITVQKMAEESLRRRMEMLSLIASTSSQLITLPTGQISQQIEATLASIGNQFAVDRAYVFHYSPDRSTMSNIYEWCSPGIKPEIQNLQDLPCSEFPWWNAKIQRQEIINIPSIPGMEPEASYEQGFLAQQGIQSLIVLPLVRSDGVAGFIGFDSVKAERAWKEEEARVLEILSSAFAQALDRKAADESIRNSEEKFRTLYDNAGDSIFITNLIGTILDVNKQGCQRMALPYDEIIGRNIIDFVAKGHVWRVPLALQEIYAKNDISFEIQSVNALGAESWIDVNARVLQFAGQRSILMISRDIQERKNAESALRFEKERLDVTLNSITDGVIVTDMEQNILLLNRTASEMLGLHSEAVGSKLSDVYRIVDEKSGEDAESAILVAIRDRFASTSFRKILRPNHNPDMLINESAAPILQDGMPLGAVLVLHDVSIEKMLEEEISKASRIRSIGTLAGGIAHDFNNLLTILMGQYEMLRRDELDKQEIIERLNDWAIVFDRAKQLSDQLLTFSQGGAPIKQLYDISSTVNDVLNDLEKRDEVHIDLALPDDLYPVEMDYRQVYQAIANIVRNAVESMPTGGGLHISAVNSYLDGDGTFLSGGEYVHLVFQDEGVGIDELMLSHIFEPYFTTKNNKTGMGLAITYSIIQKHNGHVTVSSTVGEGTTVHVYLPACKGCPIATPSVRKTEECFQRENVKVLIMDDEEMLLDVAKEMLDSLGHRADQAHDGIEAVRMYMEAKEMGTPYDLVIMDLTIPGGMGGKEAIALLLEKDPEARAIVSSGYSKDPVMAEFESHGFKAVMPKPYSMSDLRSAIARSFTD